MEDLFHRRNPLSQGEFDHSSPLRPSHTFSRPSGKTIYNQRKDYGQTLLKPQSGFQHHVEHLLTVRLERELRSHEDCVERLKLMEAQGRVWGQDLILQVQGQELLLRDVESKEDLDTYPLSSIQGYWAILDACTYDSLLVISVQEQNPPGTSVLLFQCERPGAEALRNSLEKVVKQWKEEQRGHHRYRNIPEVPPSPPIPYNQGTYTTLERWPEVPEPDFPVGPPRGVPSSMYNFPDHPQPLLPLPQGKVMTQVDRDVDVLNHVLSDLDLFVIRLRATLDQHKKKQKKKKKKSKGLPPESDYRDYFQKVKYAINLMSKTYQHVQTMDPLEFLTPMFFNLSFVLDHCPNDHLASTVETPLLLPEALELLEKTLQQEAYRTWKTLGTAWNVTRAEYPNGELMPGYIPTFSDGWLPPPMSQVLTTDQRDNPSQGSQFPAQGQVRVLYEFQARNPQELSIRMGDTLQVLDQRKKWWLVQDSQGHKGYVPSNVLEPLDQGHGVGYSPGQDSPPKLLPESSPEEVTAWLKDKGFSKITVRCLGVLKGHQLLQMTPEEIRAVCPEEWRRVLFKLSSVRTSLGMGPRD